ncbi:NAD(P)-dependent oxidoreductase [Agrilactobacillus fermenti]|uniref:NAD(P)-dependent oxidoreductase n=1 Tax=Agrilactobacillus fermenti TaxID=2586909 RepID=UPI003A5BEAEC
MTTMLTMESLKPEQSTFLKQTYPELTIIPVEALVADQLRQINIIYGYKNTYAKLLTQLLNDPQSKLKWLQTISAGVDYLPLAQLAKKHILVSSASGIHAQAISQNVFGYLLYWARALDKAIAAKTQHQYGLDPQKIVNLDGKTMMIFGTGHIGQQIAKVAQVFNMHVIGVNRSGRAKPSFDQIVDDQGYAALLADVAYIVNVMPLTTATHHFFNAQFFEQVNHQATFINVGRGPSVDETALINALSHGQIKAAALDVFEMEPLPQTSPLWQMNNVLITPHTSGLLEHFRIAFFNVFKPNLAQFMKDGTLIRNQIDYHAGY